VVNLDLMKITQIENVEHIKDIVVSDSNTLDKVQMAHSSRIPTIAGSCSSSTNPTK
jgi:hypothetical protein